MMPMAGKMLVTFVVALFLAMGGYAASRDLLHRSRGLEAIFTLTTAVSFVGAVASLLWWVWSS